MFGPGYPWSIEWMPRIIPNVVKLCRQNPHRTVFTRFLPPCDASNAYGSWKRYYNAWSEVTRKSLDAGATDVISTLALFSPPAVIVNKSVYSPWLTPQLGNYIKRRKIDTAIISGGETDVCVLATAMGAIDRGLRVVIASDAICSSCDSTHDNILMLYENRFSFQVEVATTDEIISQWPHEQS
ncbi:cysteine hydrolase family protein [Ketogulonicigenium vulgare]|uniref:cysteine hydrolase family protein n=1 Tax=Ketogulonicigenium vulgare TaxID=92945 RepID=UPI002358DD43|nr:cysteine hydrolase [Ketogulonicigenium vulgare]